MDPIINNVKDLITKNGGEVYAVDKWGRKRLAFPIRKKNNGFYAYIEFAAPSDIVQKLERAYQLDEQILRYLTVTLDKKALQAKELAAAEAKRLAEEKEDVVEGLPTVEEKEGKAEVK
jgi:small subunit ribosomal protein S6